MVKSYNPATLEWLVNNLAHGSAYAFIQSQETWREDIKEARPQFATFTPAFMNEIYQDFLHECECNPEKSEREIGKTYKNTFGNRLQFMNVGGAPPSQEVLNFCQNYIAMTTNG